MDNKTQLEIANTIFSQMGGTGRLQLMVNGKHFAAGQDSDENAYAAFHHMKGNDGINHTRITLMGDDTYTMTCSRIHGANFTEKATREMLFFDDLIPVFRELTGLEIIMPLIRGIYE